MTTSTAPKTVSATYLSPIDRDGLMTFAEKGRNNPGTRGTNKVHTVLQGMYRSLSYVGEHTPVVDVCGRFPRRCRLYRHLRRH